MYHNLCKNTSALGGTILKPENEFKPTLLGLVV